MDCRIAGWKTYVSLDSQLSNCVHVAPFTGPHRCPYCDEKVMATGIACLVSHLLLKHRRLQLSWFSCICCMGVNALSWASWVNHWDKFHRAATSLMVVLNETSCHSRHSWGVAMLSIVTFAYAGAPKSKKTGTESETNQSVSSRNCSRWV